MNNQTKQCQNCQQEFTIEPEDFEFYQKLKVPAPTWCPDCRLQRRLSWRNEFNLYHNQCQSCGKKVISVFHPDSPYTVYCSDCWYSDKWDPLNYGRDYDFSRPFFEQMAELLREVPHLALVQANAVNSEYTHLAADSKDCYLLFESSNNENCNYSYWMQQSKDCQDCAFVNNSELCYEVFMAWNCHNLSYSRECINCLDSMFLKSCVDCSDCYGCVNLKHKKYHIFNKPYSKEEYQRIITEKKEKIKQGRIEELKKEFEDFVLTQPHKYAFVSRSVDCTGDYILNAKNCHYAFHASDAENCKFAYHVWRKSRDNMDVSTVGRRAELVYESMNTGIGAFGVKFGIQNWNDNNNLEYTYTCQGSGDLFGCVGLRQKQYCILNKQYSPEEYKELVEKIKRHMDEMPYVDQRGRIYKYGEFYPPELSLFAYNESSAQGHFPLDKEGAKEKGYRWREEDNQRNYQVTLKTTEIPADIDQVDDSILKEIIQCATPPEEKHLSNCVGAFRIIPAELKFYKKRGLPLPKYCPNCRRYQRLKYRNPLKLYRRKCMKEGCQNEFETTFAPDRPEIIYCEQCYNELVN